MAFRMHNASRALVDFGRRVWARGRRHVVGSDSSSTAAPQVAPPVASDVEERLKAIFDDGVTHRPFALAHLQLLNLADIREQVGDRWPKVQRLVHLLTETTLYRNLESDDFFFNCRDDVYVLVFPTSTPQQAAAKCQKIVDDISRQLFGDKKATPLSEESESPRRLTAAAASLRIGKQEVHAAGSVRDALSSAAIDLANKYVGKNDLLWRRIGKAFETASNLLTEAGTNQARERIPEIVRRLSTLAEQLKALERELIGQAIPSQIKPKSSEISYHPIEWDGLKPGYTVGTTPAWQTISGIGSDPLARLSKLLSSVEEHMARFETIVEAGPEPDDTIDWALAPDGDISYTIDYLPMFETRRSIVAIYLARIRFKLGHLPVTLDELLSTEDNLEVRAIASRLVVRTVAMQESPAKKGNSLRAISVDDAVFRSAPHRRIFFEFVSNLQPQIRRQLICEVVLHNDWQPLQVEQYLLQLHPFCRAIFLRLPLPERSIEDLALLSLQTRKIISAIGLTARGAQVNEELFLLQLKELAQECEQRSVNTYLVEVPSFSVFLNAISLGVAFTSGADVLPPSASPSALHKQTIEDIYTKHAAAIQSRPIRVHLD